MKYDKRAIISCDACDATEFQVFYTEEDGMPETCPFCAQPLEDVRIFEKDEFEELEDYIKEFNIEEDD